MKRLALGASAIAALSCALALGGCGLGPRSGTGAVSLTVTQSFGAIPVGSLRQPRVPGSETVMRMLQGAFRVRTRYGGRFVESIDGHAATGSQLDWSYYVNGIEAHGGAAGTTVHRGDQIWWDLHDRSATNSVPAVVGSFPEPFVHGIGGKRLPTTLGCAMDAGVACARVAAALRAAGVPVSSQLLGIASGSETLGVVVGTWRELQPELAARLIEHGPSASGVYARFTGTHGESLQLLDSHARAVRTLGAGAGLIAATADNISAPTWLVTGTDLGGVSAAAAAMTERRLGHHYALAVQGGTDLPVPTPGAGAQ
ncbi:MAG: DUF4430 domain-containing protein [Solirubrobacteraceae bacterium]